MCLRFAMTPESMFCGQMTKKSIFLFKMHNSVFVNFMTVLSTSSKTERQWWKDCGLGLLCSLRSRVSQLHSDQSAQVNQQHDSLKRRKFMFLE